MSGYTHLEDIRSIEAVPLADRRPPRNTYETLRRGAEIAPGAPALLFFLEPDRFDQPISFTYRDLLESVRRFANLLHALGTAPEDVVSILLPNLPETFFALFGGEAAAIVNPVNPLLEPETIAEILNAARARVLVTLAPFPGTDTWHKVEAVADGVPSLETILRVDLARYLDEDRRRAVRAARSPEAPALRARVLDLDAALDGVAGDRLVAGREIRGGDIASYFHTGGTTGVPKLARHTHWNEASNIATLEHFLELGPGKVLYCGLPLFHVNGVFVTGLWPWSRGATVVLGPPQGYRAPGLLERFWRIVEHYRLSFFSTVPTVYSALLDVPVGECRIDTLEFGLCGSAPMPVEVFRRFEEATGIRILEGYGLTEGTCVVAANPALGERRVGSIGLRLPYQELKVVVLDAGGGFRRAAGVDEIGMVVLRGPNVFSGYKEEAHDRSAWLDTGDGGGRWLVTGDLGREDADGYFWLTGRAKELIIRGGHNIDPQTVEDPLHRHPAVALAAAVGRPDARVGEVPVAYVKLKSGVETTEDEILAFAREHIGERAAVPKAIRIVESLPLTAVGKIFKPALVRREIERVLGEEIEPLAEVSGVEVEALAHPVHGIVARVRVEGRPDVSPGALEGEVRRILGRYAVRFELEVATGPV